MEIINTYPSSAGLTLLVAVVITFIGAVIISGFITLVFLPNDDKGAESVIKVGLWIFWTIMCIGVPILYMDFTEFHQVQDEFYQNMPTECAQAATGPDAQRRVECTITISKERDFVIIDGRFMPLEEAPESDADHDASEGQPRAQ